jgi:hypothetical protein
MVVVVVVAGEFYESGKVRRRVRASAEHLRVRVAWHVLVADVDADAGASVLGDGRRRQHLGRRRRRRGRQTRLKELLSQEPLGRLRGVVVFFLLILHDVVLEHGVALRRLTVLFLLAALGPILRQGGKVAAREPRGEH